MPYVRATLLVINYKSPVREKQWLQAEDWFWCSRLTGSDKNEREEQSL